jgi:hypothetical protein
MRLLLSCLALLMLALGPANAATGPAYCRDGSTADCCDGDQPCTLPGAGCAPSCTPKIIAAEQGDSTPRIAVTAPLPVLSVAQRAGTGTPPPHPPPRAS